MLSENNKISTWQLQILLIIDIFGTGMTALPRLVGAQAGVDSWICILIATAIVALFSYIMCLVSSKHPAENFFELASKLLTKPVAVIISAAFLIRIIMICATELRAFGEIVRLSILPTAPFPIIAAVMLAIAAYPAYKGYETRARTAEILILVIFTPLILIFGMAIFSVDYSNLLPVLVSSTPTQIGSGTLTAIWAFKGVELVLLAFPYVSNRSKKTAAHVASSIALTGVLMTAVTTLTIARFGLSEVTRQMWPVLEMMDTTLTAGSFFDRLDAMMMSFWIVSVFAITSACIFFGAVLCRDVANGFVHRKKSSHKTLIIPLAIIVLFVSFLPRNITEVFSWKASTDKILGAAFIFALPLLLFIGYQFRKKD